MSSRLAHTLVMVGALLCQSMVPATAKPGEASDQTIKIAPSMLEARPIYGILGDIEAWQSYKRRFVSERGRVVDTANGRISHSEGQGYGMLLAVAAGDRETFRRIWVWTRTELMVRKDALVAWRWKPDSRAPVTDFNNATDGDLLIAWALGEAAVAWSDDEFRVDSRRIARDVGRRAILWKAKGGPLLLPGIFGFATKDRKRGPVVNLSYWVFPAFPRLLTVAPEFDWSAVAGSGLNAMRQARFGPRQLPTDWVAMGGGMPEPAPGFPPIFSYNAIRMPLYLALAGDTDRSDYDPFLRLWGDVAMSKLPIVDTQTGRDSGWMTEPGYEAVAALTRCAALDTALPDWFLHPSQSENYYPATLHLLALLAVRERYASCLKS